MQDGFDFIWRFGRRPYFVTAALKIVKLIVKGDIPYLYPGSPDCQPVDPDDEYPLPPWRVTATGAPATRVATSESSTQTEEPLDAFPSVQGGSSSSSAPPPPSTAEAAPAAPSGSSTTCMKARAAPRWSTRGLGAASSAGTSPTARPS